MLVDIAQTRDAVRVSFINKDGQIELKDIPAVFDNYVVCEDDDPEKDTEFENWDGQSIKRRRGFRFHGLNIREFLTKKISQELQDELFGYNLPNWYSIDIEIDITDCEGFPEAEIADWPIASISVTGMNLSTVIYYTDASKRYDRSEAHRKQLEDEINEHFDDVPVAKRLIQKYAGGRLKYNEIFFDSEIDMLTTFLRHQGQFYHCIFGWNWNRFDRPYIKNRAAKLGIDRTIASPTREIDDRFGDIKHRLEIDYLEICDQYMFDIWKMSMALSYIGHEALGISKVNYDGSFLDLYNNPHLFQLYSAVDTIVVMMIHHHKSYVNGHLMKAFYAKIPIAKAFSTMAVGDALFFDQLYARNKMFLDTREREEDDGSKYEGGFVVSPRYKEAEWISMVDLKSLYPSIIRSLKCSPDKLVKESATKQECMDALATKQYTVSMNNNIYSLEGGDGIVPATMSYLIEERYHYKNLYMYINNEIAPVLKELLQERGIYDQV